MDKQNPVYTLINECHDCYRCVRECHVKAIKIEDGHASVIPDKCIACGACVKACPAGAKRVRTDIDKAKKLLLSKKDVYVSLAPSWSGVFEMTEEKIISILKRLGFKDVSETALGAEEVSIKTAELLNNAEKGLFISSACPVIVDFIRHYHPEFTNNITPIGSPAMTHAKMLKEKFGEDISIVFIGPCIGKKNESDHGGLIDVALTFEELKRWINDDIGDISNVSADNKNKFVPHSAHEGALYPIDGGMNETIKRVGIKENIQLIDICGLANFEKALTNLKPEKIDKVIFVEGLSCEGGCVAGPCISTEKAGISVVSDVLSNVKHRLVIPKKPAGRDMAVALLNGDAETSMCVSYMRKIAVRKAAAMFRCMPAAVVMVDNNMNILEANDSFMKMFTGDMYEIFKARPDGMTGAAIDRIVDFADIFKTILKTGKDLHKERYPVKNRLFDISAFTIEENEIVGAIITDVTQTETNREKISQKAHEVISKNISIVQEIACLLGEHMVETETLLSSIANDFDDKDETSEDVSVH